MNFLRLNAFRSDASSSEAAQIRLDDLRPEQNAILINGKGGPYGKNAKHRLVPLNPSSYKALRAYLSERERLVNKSQVDTRALFFSRAR